MRSLGERPVGDAYDVVVVGSGAAALMAAAVAAHRGRSVLVLEKSALVGGTSSISAGTVWVPCNPYEAELGLDDDPQEALRYLLAVADGRGDPDVLTALVSSGGEMLRFAREHCGLVFDAAPDYPDYRPELAGAATGGRSLQPRLFDVGALGEVAPLLRRDPTPPYTMAEFKAWGSWNEFPWAELERRAEQGWVARGGALVAPLLAACLEGGVQVAVEAPVEELTQSGRAVTGVRVGGRGVAARAGVVLACGGFEWDEDMVERHLGGRLRWRCSPPANTGDGHRMARAAGVELRDLDQAWWAPMAVVGDTRDGRPVGRLVRTERQGPGSIMVDPTGRRFADESQNYNSLVRAYHATAAADPGRCRAMFVVFDQRFLDRFGFLTHRSGGDLPAWLTCAASPGELAEALGIDPAGLAATLDRFNRFARDGADPDFGRGDDVYDRYGGDAANPYPNPCLAPVDTAPYYGMPLEPGAFGTSGGVLTDARGRALDPDRDVVPGLFAAGNASAHPVAAGYPGAGGTLGPALTMAYLAGVAVAGG